MKAPTKTDPSLQSWVAWQKKPICFACPRKARMHSPGCIAKAPDAVQLSKSALLCSRRKLSACRPPPRPSSASKNARNFCLVQPPLRPQNSRERPSVQTPKPQCSRGCVSKASVLQLQLAAPSTPMTLQTVVEVCVCSTNAKLLS